MGYCRVCDYCGANLDPGEACDCVEARARRELPPAQIAPYPPRETEGVDIFFSAKSRVGGCGIICEKI